MELIQQSMKDKSIICLKWGTKYSSHYVNVLYNMCKRHSLEDFDFICLTEDPTGLDSNIIVKALPIVELTGWWFKPFVFSRALGLKGTALFLDLDIVISSNIDKLWNFDSDAPFVIIRDFVRHKYPAHNKFNSSVFRYKVENFYWIWDHFLENKKIILSKYRGDQDFLFAILAKKATLWPDQWIKSYKWEIRNKQDLIFQKGKRMFGTLKNTMVEEECCISVFHGDPKPPECKDRWVIKNWQ
jgi:hypothetical protein